MVGSKRRAPIATSPEKSASKKAKRSTDDAAVESKKPGRRKTRAESSGQNGGSESPSRLEPSTSSSSASSHSTSVDLDTPHKGQSLPLEKLTANLTCFICKGYFIDAHTISECLHTFCKSCLLRHFEKQNNCPKCDQIVHQSHPKNYIAYDRTMQDIVYKLIPGLFNQEMERRKQYKAEKRKAAGKPEAASKPKPSKEEEKATNRCMVDEHPRHSHHRDDDAVIVRLIPERDMQTISRPVIRTSHMTTVNTLKRYLAMVLWNDASRYNRLALYCNGEFMGKDFSMRFIQMTQWRHHKTGTPVVLTYRPHRE